MVRIKDLFKRKVPIQNVDFLALHARKNNNVGDRWCCPIDYFDFPNSTCGDLRDSPPAVDEAQIVIFGGGAITRSTKRWRKKKAICKEGPCCQRRTPVRPEKPVSTQRGGISTWGYSRT